MNNFAETIEAAFQKSVAPMLPDGGGAKIIALDEKRKTLVVSLISTCTYCPNSERSALALVGRLKKQSPTLSQIIAMVSNKVVAEWKEKEIVHIR